MDKCTLIQNNKPMNQTLLRLMALEYEMQLDKKGKHIVDLIIEAYMAGANDMDKLHKEALKPL